MLNILCVAYDADALGSANNEDNTQCGNESMESEANVYVTLCHFDNIYS